MKKIKHPKTKIVKVLLEYGIHFWVLLFLINAVVFYAVHFFLVASTCMTPQQVAADNRCLYIWGKQVFQKGSRDAPHQGHPCGTDVTSVIPASHIGNQASYLLPNYVADICSTAAPTNTPTPKPTNTPTPRPTNTPTPTPTTIPPSPTLTASPTPTQAAAPTVAQATPTPTSLPTTIPVATPTLTPTTGIATPTTPLATQFSPTPPQLPSPTLIPTATPIPSPTPVGPVLSLNFSLPGIGSNASVLNPLHPNRPVTIYIYASDVDSRNITVHPLYTQISQATFDNNTASPTYGTFVNRFIDLGTIPANTYQIAIKTPNALTQLITSDTKKVGGDLIALSPQQTTTLPSQQMSLGDLAPYPNGDNTVNIADYNILVNCFGYKAEIVTFCPDKQAADLNDDGLVDGIDYNLLLLGFKNLLALGGTIPVLPTVQPTPTQQPTPTPSPTRAIIAQATPTPEPTLPQTATNPPTQPPLSPTKAPEVRIAGSTLSAFFSKLLAYGTILFIFGTAIFGAYRSKLLRSLLPGQQAATPHKAEVTATTPPPAREEQIDTNYLVQQKSKTEKGTWVSLTNDSGEIDGFSPTDIPDGFAHIKGIRKQEEGKLYIEISQVLPAE